MANLEIMVKKAEKVEADLIANIKQLTTREQEAVMEYLEERKNG